MPMPLTNTTDNIPQNEEENKYPMQETFYKAFCKTGIVSKDLIRITLKPSSTVVTAKENMQQSLRDPFVNRQTFIMFKFNLFI